MGIEHVFKGKANERQFAGVSIVEFRSRDEREQFLKICRDQHLVFKDRLESKVDIDRAKTVVQRERNTALHQAKMAIEKHPSGQGKNVEIKWLLEGSKNRHVSVNDVPAFLQSVTDSHGSFCGVFSNLHL